MKLKLFLLSFFLTTGVLLVVIYNHRPRQKLVPEPVLVQIGSDLFLPS